MILLLTGSFGNTRLYIYTNLLYTSIHGYQKKISKPSMNKRLKYLESPPGVKRKNIIGQKERKGQPRHTS